MDIRIGMDVFPKINTGNRTTKMGLEGDFTYTKDYMGILVPAQATEEELTKGKKVVLKPTVTVSPKSGFKILVDVNPKLYEYGNVNCVSIIEPELGEQPEVLSTEKFVKKSKWEWDDKLLKRIKEEWRIEDEN